MINYIDIKDKFASLGITEVGIVSANNKSIKFLNEQSTFGFSKKISCVDDILPGAESIIVYLVPYFSGIIPENLSVYATGEDYHNTCTNISKEISNLLLQGGFKSISYADSGPISERLLAFNAGLGIIGENGFLINKKYGSYTFIGYIITDLELDATTPLSGSCKKCGMCFKSCPGKALSKTYFNEKLCLSYITQKKGKLSQTEENLIKSTGCAWGCDICQKCCPMNENIEKSPLEQFNDNLILCIKNEYLSNKQFKDKYKNRAFSWRGKQVVYRNLSILNDKI